MSSLYEQVAALAIGFIVMTEEAYPKIYSFLPFFICGSKYRHYSNMPQPQDCQAEGNSSRCISKGFPHYHTQPVKSNPAFNATTMTNPNVNLKYSRSTSAALICTKQQRRKE